MNTLTLVVTGILLLVMEFGMLISTLSSGEMNSELISGIYAVCIPLFLIAFFSTYDVKQKDKL